MAKVKSELKSPKHISQNHEQQGVVLNKDEVKQMIESAKIEVLETARTETKNEINVQVQTDKASLITVFGIFASITSFLTIEFQFLKTLTSLKQILGFTLVLCAMLFGFNIALDYLVKSRLDSETPKPVLFFCLFVTVLFFVGIVLVI